MSSYHVLLPNVKIQGINDDMPMMGMSNMMDSNIMDLDNMTNMNNMNNINNMDNNHHGIKQENNDLLPPEIPTSSNYPPNNTQGIYSISPTQQQQSPSIYMDNINPNTNFNQDGYQVLHYLFIFNLLLIN